MPPTQAPGSPRLPVPRFWMAWAASRMTHAPPAAPRQEPEERTPSPIGPQPETSGWTASPAQAGRRPPRARRRSPRRSRPPAPRPGGTKPSGHPKSMPRRSTGGPAPCERTRHGARRWQKRGRRRTGPTTSPMHSPRPNRAAPRGPHPVGAAAPQGSGTLPRRGRGLDPAGSDAQPPGDRSSPPAARRSRSVGPQRLHRRVRRPPAGLHSPILAFAISLAQRQRYRLPAATNWIYGCPKQRIQEV
jgi:translation initiation factor IF-2